MAMKKKKTINFKFSDKHKDYIRACSKNMYNIAEGAVRAGKTVDNVFAFAHELKNTKDKLHLATGSTSANAKLNIGDANGFGLEYIFRGQSHWGKYKGNECLYIKGPSTNNKLRIVIFAGTALANSYKKIRGNSYGMWIATEINLHHPDSIKEAFNRTIAAHKRKVFWDLNPDNPNAFIYKDYIDNYKSKYENGELKGGYNYYHFTIDDNINISDERKEEIKSQYDKNSIWYQRDILGKRCVAEGLIYRRFANNPNSYRAKESDVSNLMKITIGVDFGGNGSGHAFVASATTFGYKKVIILSSERHFGDDIDSEKLGEIFVNFVQKINYKYGYAEVAYCDNAEQVLIRTLRNAAIKAGLSIRVTDAWKTTVNDRINATTKLMAQDRLLLTNDCKSIEDAFCTAIWNPKEITKNERLDDGTSDIDSLDGFEYSIERDIRRLLDVF
ncbi:TPA: terminase family protein [Clostridium perfringens]|nr:terminase family protein [Clostridium perfringens]EJT6161082.1 terminase family protein [Clostridium perfringens]EJT6503563.1 terminase family protein [Clostridium perfringens]